MLQRFDNEMRLFFSPEVELFSRFWSAKKNCIYDFSRLVSDFFLWKFDFIRFRKLHVAENEFLHFELRKDGMIQGPFYGKLLMHVNFCVRSRTTNTNKLYSRAGVSNHRPRRLTSLGTIVELYNSEKMRSHE